MADWPREYYVNLIDLVSRGGAKVLVFDIGFIEPNADDPAVTEALRRFLNPDPERMREAGLLLRRRAVILPIVGIGDQFAEPSGLLSYPKRIEDVSLYRDLTTLEGHANVAADGDGTVRTTPLVIRAGGVEFPSLA